jgi:hypothetical protein
MDGRRLAGVVGRGGEGQNPAYRPTHPPCPDRARIACMPAIGNEIPAASRPWTPVRYRSRRREVMRLGAGFWLDACSDPEIQRIVLVDAPAVLGWTRWTEIGNRYNIGMVPALLTDAI